MSSSYSSRDDDVRRQELRRDDRRRSRSNSVDRHRRRHHRSSRSPSRGSCSQHKSSRRHRENRSRSRSHTHSRSNWSINRSSRSPKRSSQRQESRRTRSRSRSRSNERHSNKRHTSDRESVSQRSKESRKPIIEENSSTQYFSSTDDADHLDNLPLPDQAENNSNSYEYYDATEEPFDKARIHREMEEKLRLALAKEGKVYPPPKPEASHPVFANDGSFLEIFKKMQEAQQQQSMSTTSTAMPAYGTHTASTSVAAYAPVTYAAQPPPPVVGRRRGGKILKTGVVAKPKALLNGNGDDKDFWSLYLAEVNKYKNNACELDSGNRPLLK